MRGRVKGGERDKRSRQYYFLFPIVFSLHFFTSGGDMIKSTPQEREERKRERKRRGKERERER